MAALLVFAGFATSAATADDLVTVCASGCDYTSINTAIEEVDYHGVVQLSAETYTEGSAIETRGKPITLLGATDKDGNATSILDGGGIHLVIKCVSSETSATILKNLVIQNGDRGMSNTFASPTLINCTFRNNSSAGAGAGIFNYGSSPTLTNCTFTGNSAHRGGGMYNGENSNPTLTDCVFESNWSQFDGAGMYNYGSSPTLANCTFTSNWAGNEGGGMYSQNNDQESSPTLTDCAFTSNSAEYGGGGIYNYECSSSLNNCTFGENSQPAIGGSVLVDTLTVSTPAGVPGDLDGDGDVDIADFVLLRNQLGVDNLGCVAADINGDGMVDGADLPYVLGEWGICGTP